MLDMCEVAWFHLFLREYLRAAVGFVTLLDGLFDSKC